jgi:hypothetical protein
MAFTPIRISCKFSEPSDFDQIHSPSGMKCADCGDNFLKFLKFEAEPTHPVARSIPCRSGHLADFWPGTMDSVCFDGFHRRVPHWRKKWMVNLCGATDLSLAPHWPPGGRVSAQINSADFSQCPYPLERLFKLPSVSTREEHFSLFWAVQLLEQTFNLRTLT